MCHSEQAKRVEESRRNQAMSALGQRDPVVEYKREGYHMFQVMFESIHIDVAEMIFKLQPVEETERVKRVFSGSQQLVHQEFSGMTGALHMASPEQAAPETAMMPEHHAPVAHQPSEMPKVGRNDACPCGSGKKFKKCCGK